jgi:hypothetical protein
MKMKNSCFLKVQCFLNFDQVSQQQNRTSLVHLAGIDLNGLCGVGVKGVKMLSVLSGLKEVFLVPYSTEG